MNPYLKSYRWSNIFAMLKNNKSVPLPTNQSATGKLVVITGATSGIGYHTAHLYASKGADLICINRNAEKSVLLESEIKQQYGVSCVCHLADFSRLEDIRQIAGTLSTISRNIDVVIHNAGVYNTHRTITMDGIEEVFQINYLASFIITHALIKKLSSQNHARIIYVNSEGHRFALHGIHVNDLLWERHHYTGLKSYGSAKTAQLLSLFYFVKKFTDTGVTINAMHPGDVRTNIGENNGKLYRFFKHHIINPSAKPATLSAQALYYLGISEDLKTITGKFFNYTAIEEPAPHALDEVRAQELINHSLRLGGINEPQTTT